MTFRLEKENYRSKEFTRGQLYETPLWDGSSAILVACASGKGFDLYQGLAMDALQKLLDKPSVKPHHEYSIVNYKTGSALFLINGLIAYAK